MRQNDKSTNDRAAAVEDTDDFEPAGYDGRPFDEDELVVVDTGARTRRVLIGAVAGVVVVLLLAAFLLRGESRSERAAAAAPGPAEAAPVTVSTAPAVTRELPVFIEATGSLTPYESTDVAPEVAGQIVSTPVDVGDFVRKGQVLAKLDDRDARLRVEQAQAALAQARANVRQAREKLGATAGEALDPSRVAEVEAARSQMQLAEANERRYRALVESGDVARAQYDEFRVKAETARRQYEAALAAARSGGAGVDVASSSVQSAEAQLGLARKALADMTIVAPLDGFVSERPAAAGEWVTTTNKIATVVQTGTLKLVLTVSEVDAGRIRVGMPVALKVDAFQDRDFQGQISAINPSLETTSRSLQAIVTVRNPENLLRPGMFATAKVTEPSAGRTGVVVPAESVQPTSTGASRVYVIHDNRAEARVVQVGQRDAGYVQVVSGVSEGDLVATSNLDQLTDGAAIVK